MFVNLERVTDVCNKLFIEDLLMLQNNLHLLNSKAIDFYSKNNKIISLKEFVVTWSVETGKSKLI
jgi:hypothetical protein